MMGILKGHSSKKERLPEFFFLFYYAVIIEFVKSVEALHDSCQVHMSSSLKITGVT